MSRSRHARIVIRVPSPALAEHLLCTITRDCGEVLGTGADATIPANFYSSLTLIHSGCIVDEETGQPHPPVALTGPLTRPKRLRYAAGTSATTAVLKPGRADRLLGLASQPTLNAVVNAASVMPPSIYAGLTSRIGRTSSVERRALALEAFLGDRLPQQQGETAFRRGLHTLLWRLPSMRATELSASLGLLPRSLHRRFTQELGIAPKRFARLMRLHEVLWRMLADPSQNGAELASTCGFADQAHLLREFKALVGTTPAALLTELQRADEGHWPFQLPPTVMGWCHAPPALRLAA